MSQNKEITTLDQAELTLYKAGAIENNMVEGKTLLDVCGYKYMSTRTVNGKEYPNDTSKQKLERQIKKHKFVEGADFFDDIDGDKHDSVEGIDYATTNGCKTTYHFTVNAANHILLAAMTAEGKVARQEAIDLKMQTQTKRQKLIANHPWLPEYCLALSEGRVKKAGHIILDAGREVLDSPGKLQDILNTASENTDQPKHMQWRRFLVYTKKWQHAYRTTSKTFCTSVYDAYMSVMLHCKERREDALSRRITALEGQVDVHRVSIMADVINFNVEDGVFTTKLYELPPAEATNIIRKLIWLHYTCECEHTRPLYAKYLEQASKTLPEHLIPVMTEYSKYTQGIKGYL